MQDGHYILPGELAILLAFLIIPPLLIASGGHVWFLLRRGVPASRVWLSLLLMVFLSVVATVLLFVFASGVLPRALGMQDVFLGHRWLPVLPLAFVVVALVAPSVSLWVGRRRV